MTDSTKSTIMCIVFRRRRSKAEYLLLLRKKSKGAFWQPVVGRKKIGESLIHACYRELQEEAGIRKTDIIKVFPDIHSYRVEKHYLTGEPIEPVVENVYAAEVKGNIFIDIEHNPSKEHSQYEWFGYDQAITMLKWWQNKRAFEKAKKIIEAVK